MKQPEQKPIDQLLKQMGDLADEIIELQEDGHYRDRLINLYDHADTVFSATNIKRLLDIYESDKKALMGASAHYQKRAEEAERKLQQPIKLPDLRRSVSGDRYVWSDGVYNYRCDLTEMLIKQGYKVDGQ
jgi:hypothetical protein